MAAKKKTSFPDLTERPAREIFNFKISNLVHGNKQESWNPAGIYSDYIWLRKVSAPHYWPENYWIRQNNRKYICIQIVLEGDLMVTCEKKKIHVKAGDCIVIPQGNSVTATGPSGHCKKIYCIPVGKMITKFASDLQFDHVTLIPDFYTPEIRSLYQKICKLHEEKVLATLPELAALSYQLIMMISSHIPQRSYPPELIRCMDYIEENLTYPITLELLCKKVGIGKNKLKALFREHLQNSPGRYINDFRLNTALKMLDNGVLLIKEVALNCGFQNPLYFSYAFKQKFGVSPKHYMDIRRDNSECK